MIAGSSSLLAVESFGYSRGRVERDAAADVASDDAAYLGLIDRDGRDSVGVETNGLLFETNPDRNRYPTAAFDLINQLPESITVTLALADDRFRFRSADGAEIDGTRLVADDLEPGGAIGTAIDLHPCADCPTVGTSLTTPIEIRADGATTYIEAERTLTLASDVLAVLDLCALERLPDAVIAIRNRRADGVTSSLLVERIDCADGTSTVLYDRSVGELPTLRLPLPDAAAPNDRDRSTAASNDRDRAGSNRASAADREPSSGSFGAAVTAADGVSVALETAAVPNVPRSDDEAPNGSDPDGETPNGSRSDDAKRRNAADSEPHAPVVTVDLAANGGRPGLHSRSDRQVVVPLENDR